MHNFLKCFLAVVLLLSCSLASNASNLVDYETIESVEKDLRNSRFDEVEGFFDKLFQPTENEGDILVSRAVFDFMFDIANNDQLTAVYNWSEAVPDSRYALTALAMMRHHRAYLLRGTQSAPHTPREAFNAFHEEISAAQTLIGSALAIDPDFPPALEVAILLQRVNNGPWSVSELTERLIDVSPNRRAIHVALDALLFRWGGSFSENVDLCVRLARKVKDYDNELCFIELAFRNRVSGKLRDAALKALDTRDEEFLDYARLDAYLRDWRHRPEAAKEVQRLHRASLTPFLSIQVYEANLNRIAGSFNLPFYELDAREAARKMTLFMLERSPQDHILATFLINDAKYHRRRRLGTLPKEEVAELLRLWPNMVELGGYNASMWEAGGLLATLDGVELDDLELQKININVVYYSNHAPHRLRGLMNGLYFKWKAANGKADGPDYSDDYDYHSSILCPMVRVSRVFEAICQHNPNLNGCNNVGGWDAIFPGHVRRISKASKQCRVESQSEIPDLLYSPLHVSKHIFKDALK